MIALFSALLFSGAASAQQQNVSIVENQNYIEVNGYSKAEVAPDEIYISFQINESDTKGRTAVSETEQKMVAALRNLGINIEEQLTVKDMSSNFQKYILRRTDIQQSREYQLKVADAGTAASVFAALESVEIANGSITKAEYSGIEEFVLENKVAAIKNAQHKAARLAEAVGQAIGKAIYIQDFERTYRAYAANVMTKAMSADMATGGEMAPGIEFEKITVESNVTVRFLLE